MNPSRPKQTVALVLGAVVVLFGLALWRTADSAPRAKRASSDAEEPQPPPSTVGAEQPIPAAPRTVKRPFLTRPAELFVDADEEAARRYRRQQAKELFGTVRRRLGIARTMSPDPNPQSLDVQTAEYLEGWTDGVVRGAPDLIHDFASEVHETLCASDQDEALLLVTFRLMSMMPELASDEAFECIFGKHTEEDIVLWRALDAWRASGLPKSASIEAIERRATDERTHVRLQPRQATPHPSDNELEAAAGETLTATRGNQP